MSRKKLLEDQLMAVMGSSLMSRFCLKVFFELLLILPCVFAFERL